MKKMFVKIKESVEEKLRKLCAGLSPEKRVPAIVMLAALFAIGNFYMIFRAIHDIGREDVRPEIIEIPPIEIPDVVPADTLPDKRVQEMEEFFFFLIVLCLGYFLIKRLSKSFYEKIFIYTQFYIFRAEFTYSTGCITRCQGDCC